MSVSNLGLGVSYGRGVVSYVNVQSVERWDRSVPPKRYIICSSTVVGSLPEGEDRYRVGGGDGK